MGLAVVEELARDSDDGPGWSALVDVDRCPTYALPWLAQLAGVSLLPIAAGETEEAWDASMRERIRRADARSRGRPDAIRAAAERQLTGTKWLIFNERAGDPYVLGVATRLDETPDQAAVQRAIREQKPAGIVLNYLAVDGQTYDLLALAHDDYDAVQAAYPDYDAVRDDNP